LCISTWLIGELFCQNTIGLPQIINYGENDFKGGAQTWKIKQDKWGRMYFANNEGLITFDGKYWKVYQQPNKTILRSIAIHQDRIYAGGQDEIGYFAPNHLGVLQYHSLRHLIPKGKTKFTDIWDIEVYKDAVYFRSWDWIFEFKNDVIQPYKANNGWQSLKLAGNKLIAQDKDMGLFQFANNEWQPMPNVSAIKNVEVSGIVELNDGSLLIASLYNGFFKYVDNKLIPYKTGNDNYFIKHHINTFDKLNENELIVGTGSDGCVMINQSGDIIQQISLKEGLQNNNVLRVFIDSQKNIWTGLNNGISFIGYSNAIKYIKPNKENDVSGHSCRIYQNKIYIATSDGAYVANLPQLNGDLSFTKGNFNFIKNSNGQNWRLDEVSQLLLLGHHNGTYLIQNDNAVQLTNNGGKWLFIPFSPVYPSKFILAGAYSGLHMFQLNNNKIIDNWEVKGPYESNRFLAIDNTGEIWSSHPYRGVYKISLAEDKKSHTSTLYTQANGLPSTMRNFVFKIKNRLVFATEKGIYEYDGQKNNIIYSAFFSKIFGTTPIQYLNEDANGNIWFCTEKKLGVVRFMDQGKKHAITYFPELTGKVLAGFENIYAFNDENIFIAAKNGIIHLNYKKYLANLTKTSILLTQVKMTHETDSLIFGGYFTKNEQQQKKQDKNSILKVPITYNSFHFEFSSPSFSMLNNIEYSYKLEGYQDSWTAWSSKTEKDYTNLPSGFYTFKVKAHDNLGNESEAVSYSFRVLPPWYKTFIAYLAYALAICCSFYYYTKWQKLKFKKQQQKFEEEEKKLKYIHQLEVEKNEKTIIELQNKQLMDEMMYKNRELADVNMHLVERSDALLKVKNELQQLYKKTGGNHDVKKTISLVNDIEKNNTNWEQFASHFNEINNDVLKKIKQKFPNLTNTDLKVCAYLHLKLSSKEIAQLMNISVKGVELSRYRLRKKLQIPTEKSLTDFLNEMQQL